MKDRVVFHIDVNNAFLSWTAVYLLQNGYEKDIRKIPSVIGGEEHSRYGIVLAKSPVAKKLGVVSAEPIYMAKKKCKDLEVYPPQYKWYYEKSRELMKYLSQYSPILEQYSVDECFLDMSGMTYIYNDLEKLAYKIKDEVKEKFGYTVNIGIGNNKLCAKMASDFEKPDKVHTLYKDEIVSKLWPLDVGDLFMCGKSTKKELNKFSIYTIGDLAKKDLKFLERHFKSQGKYLYNASRGLDDDKVEVKTSKNQSISVTETLPYNLTDPDKLKEILFRQTEEITRELRSKKLFTKTVAVIFKNSNFISYSAQATLDKPTNNTKEILKKIYEVFDNNYKEDEIRLIGARLANLTNTKEEQISLFDQDENEEKEDNIQKTIDNINNKFGKSLIKPASLKLITRPKMSKKK
ncbi:MAG: DNA polymerase IV [Bacilli bacterium]|nr:DNA polymerase IV [Bacilli bacterium]